MTWNTLKYLCGHTQDVQLYGKYAQRERTVAAAANHDCPACRAVAAQTEAAAAGLPLLTGSDKQVGWAGEIRAKLITALDQFDTKCNGLLARIESGDHPPATAEKIAAARTELDANFAASRKMRGITKAGWWIERRDVPINVIIIELRKP